MLRLCFYLRGRFDLPVLHGFEHRLSNLVRSLCAHIENIHPLCWKGETALLKQTPHGTRETGCDSVR